MQTRKNDSAFPVFDDEGTYFSGGKGLTKREYFAAKIIQGLLNASFIDESYLEQIPRMTVELTEQLIKALNESETNS